MIRKSDSRRTFIKLAATATLSSTVRLSAAQTTDAAVNAADDAAGNAEAWSDHIACNEYPWWTFLERAGKGKFQNELASNLDDFASTGVNGIEPIVGSVDYLQQLKPLLNERSIQMKSLYVNSVLHDAEQSDRSITKIRAIAKSAKDLFQTSIIVTNPEPIRWGGDEDKSDAQLIHQAKMMNQLGEALKEEGLVLAYHNHDAELRAAAREMHHMMQGTDPALVSLCLDSHWMFRGAGDSVVAWKDIVSMYLDRVVELHLRQSKDGIWTEAFDAGDLDYAWLFQLFEDRARPHLVLEQSIEEKSPKEMNCTEATKASRAFVQQLTAAH